MIEYQALLLIGYLCVEGFQYWLKYLNLSHMKKHGLEVPEEFRGHVDSDFLKKTHAYTIEHSRLSLIESLFSMGVFLGFLYGGILPHFNAWITSLGVSFVVQGMIFFLLLGLASSILGIPFSLYSTFRIENRYGFNTTTGKLWITDFLKSMVLSSVLMGIVIAAGLWIVQASPVFWWFFVWGFFFIFSIFMMYISPYVIEPLFNKFTPLEGGDLETRIREIMEKAGIHVSRVFTIDASKRSHHTNAYFTGIGRVKRIVLYDTLLKKMDESEVLAVLAHEAGHWKKKHVLKMLAVFETLSLIGAYAAFRVVQTDFLSDIFRIQGETFFAKLVILGFIFSIVSFPFTPLFSAFSRRHEREADDFAVVLTGEKEGMANSLIKLSKDNLSNLHPHPLYADFYYSHPPVVERVRRIREIY